MEVEKTISRGENIRTFLSGGIGRDVSRQVEGQFTITDRSTQTSFSDLLFQRDSNSNGATKNNAGDSDRTYSWIGFDSSRVVPVGSENSVKAFSKNIWRRVN
ncbi:MAG: hypothetical protein LBI28_12785 [Treponema sp.]|jgi:hypothetical protein|nr:hypothetical protein [Treponema sp.]